MGGCIYFICLASVYLEAIREREKKEKEKNSTVAKLSRTTILAPPQ